MTPWYKKEDKF